MSEVVREYTRGRDDIQGLRKSLFETQAVLTAKKNGQIPLKELWQKKVELQETLRMVRDLESLKVRDYIDCFYESCAVLVDRTTVKRSYCTFAFHIRLLQTSSDTSSLDNCMCVYFRARLTGFSG